MGFLKKIKAKFEDFLQFEEEWQACFKVTWYQAGNEEMIFCKNNLRKF